MQYVFACFKHANSLIYEIFYSVGIVQLFIVARYFLCLMNVWKMCIQLGGLQFVAYGKYCTHCILLPHLSGWVDIELRVSKRLHMTKVYVCDSF